MVAALTATIIAPAQAGPSTEPLGLGRPTRLFRGPRSRACSTRTASRSCSSSADRRPAPTTPTDRRSRRSRADRRSGRDGRGASRPDAGSRELDCLATGIYFESKGEPLAGQLAVGKVIANRADSGGRFPDLLRRAVPARPILVRSRPLAAERAARSNRQWQTAVAIARIVDQDLKEFGGRQCAVLSRALCFAGLAPEARRLDRQPRLLPLSSSRMRAGGGRATARPLSFWHGLF